jgi:cytochrome c554/c'-like protein
MRPVLHSPHARGARPRWPATFALISALVLAAVAACQRPGASPTRVPEAPSLRLYLVSGVAGALEPCGCRKDMLGGVDHAAAWLAQERGHTHNSLLIGAGPMLFADPTLNEERRQQDLWKAEALASSFADIGLKAWAPGVNDFAAGLPTLGELRQRSQAELVAANLKSEGLALKEVEVFKVGDYTVGVAGLAAPAPDTPPAAVEQDRAAALARARAALDARGVQIRIALLAAQRGDALRLAEQAQGFHVLALGKPSDEGDGNDAPIPATLVGKTLVIQAPNHLQAIAQVDFFVKDGQLSFEDGSGLEQAEKKQSLEQRIQALEQRIASWRAAANPSAEEVAQREADVQKLRDELGRLSSARVEPQGSFFRYTLTPIKESFGSEPKVAARMLDYYKRVNDYNKQALQDRRPPEPAPGAARYVGGEECSLCHADAEAFWKKTQHANAYATLEKQFKEFNLDCVGCHVTGYEKPGGSSVTHVAGLKDVQCESCHGPGSLHAQDPSKAGAIVRTPPPATCIGCHHTPHVADDWDVKLALPKIVGPGHGQPAAAAPKP